jgi:hypothetical protein
MAQQDFGMGTYGTGHLSVNENWNNSDQVSYHIRLWATHGGGAYNYGPGPNWNGNAGGVGGSGAWSYGGNGDTNLWEFDQTYTKDANGYGTWNFYGYIDGANSPYISAGSTNFNMSPGRIGVAPGIAYIGADTIKPTSARLYGEITGYGKGTSANMNMYYRLQGSSTWIDLGNQGDIAGPNYWSISGLQPGKTYEHIMNVWNNNGDFAQSGVQTFKTQPVSGMISVMRGII